MRAVLVIEEDTLIRELMREHLERDGYATCAVATVQTALEAARWTQFGLVLLDFTSAASSGVGELARLRSLGAPVVMMSTAPRGRAISMEGAVESVVWSPFDLATLTSAVRRFLPPGRARRSGPPEPSASNTSGTYLATQTHSSAAASTIPAPADGAGVERVSLEALSALVLEATNGRRR